MFISQVYNIGFSKHAGLHDEHHVSAAGGFFHTLELYLKRRVSLANQKSAALQLSGVKGAERLESPPAKMTRRSRLRRCADEVLMLFVTLS